MFEGMEEVGLPDPVYRQGPASVIVTLLMDPIGARMLRLLPQGSERFVEFALGNERVTTAEAKELLGVSVNTARRYLTALADAGFLRRESQSARDPHGYWRLTTGPSWRRRHRRVSDGSRGGQAPTPAELLREIELLRAENARLRELLDTAADAVRSPAAEPTPRAPTGGLTLFEEETAGLPRVDAKSSAEEKIALFRALFAGRDDVYAIRWDNPRTGKAGWSPAVVGGAANAKRPDREYLPLTDAVIEAHLSGRIHVGLYPLLPDDSCRLLACDFDGPSWPLDARAYQDAAQALGIEAAIERSRSGDGAHVWILFAGRVPASVARRIGAHLLREAMTIRAELDLASYDRLFPAQDFMPKGSFGNLIALPLEGKCRRKGTTVFLDDALGPPDDQWAYLSSLRRVSPVVATSLAEQLREVAAGPMEPAYRRPFHSERPQATGVDPGRGRHDARD